MLRFMVLVTNAAVSSLLDITATFALVIHLPLAPPIPGQTGGPPLPQLVFDRTLDFSGAPVAGVNGMIDVSRIGDFNNSTTAVDPNGAPEEGVAIMGISQGTPGLLHSWVYWPGIAGTIHYSTDVPADRQHLLGAVFSQDELLDSTDPNGLTHIRLIIGRSVDDAPFVGATFHVDVVFFPGDFDFDGDVDGRDFLLWQRGGSPTPLSASDLADWQANYGVSSLASSRTVPEPNAQALLALIIVLVARHRK
jgi:hypothetical protein